MSKATTSLTKFLVNICNFVPPSKTTLRELNCDLRCRRMLSYVEDKSTREVFTKSLELEIISHLVACA